MPKIPPIFSITVPQPCGYLPDRQETMLVLKPRSAVNEVLHDNLLRHGFRCSGKYVHRPACTDCNACVPIRIPVTQFTPRRKHLRALRHNTDLRMVESTPRLTHEIFALYERYITSRHRNGSMYPPQREQFKSFLFTPKSMARFLEFRHRRQLVAVAVTHLGQHSMSATYTFFDPEMNDRSLGTYSILKQIFLARARGLDFLYLGYWIDGCRKMDYKREYAPLQLLIDNKWVSFDKIPADHDPDTGRRRPSG